MRTKKFLPSIGIGVLGTALLFSAAAQAGLSVKPVLQNIRPDSVSLMFESAHSTTATLKISVSADLSGAVSYSLAAGTIHKLSITNLAPNARYYYQVTSDGETSAVGSFQGSLPDGARLPFRFVAYGDSRLAAWYEAILASYGDNDDHLAVVQSIATYAPNFLLHLGDFAQNGNDLEAVRNFFKVEKDFLISNPVVATYGNHEFQGKSSATTSDTYFDSYLVPTPGAPDFSYYAYNYGNIHFLVISTGQYSDADESYSNLLPGTSQYNFIQSDLSAAAANPNISHIMGELVQDTRRLAQNGQPRRERLLAIEIFHSWSGPFGHCHVCCQQGPWSFGQAR